MVTLLEISWVHLPTHCSLCAERDCCLFGFEPLSSPVVLYHREHAELYGFLHFHVSSLFVFFVRYVDMWADVLCFLLCPAIELGVDAAYDYVLTLFWDMSNNFVQHLVRQNHHFLPLVCLLAVFVYWRCATSGVCSRPLS